MSTPKPGYATDSQNNANGTPWSLAHRQLRRIFTGPVFWLIVGAVSVITAMAGPYFTLSRLSFPERLVYWGTTVSVSAVVMTALSVFGYHAQRLSRLHWAGVAVLSSAAGLLPVIGTIFLAEGLATGFAAGWAQGYDLGALVLSVAPPLVFVTLAVHAVLHHQGGDARADVPPAFSAASLLQGKLPHHLGREIVSVQAQDHYIEVTTPKGSALILMRLGDAVRDLAPLGGMQVHRSWWVNPAHVTRSEKGTSGPELVLSTGARVPVGRSFRKALRAAGLL